MTYVFKVDSDTLEMVGSYSQAGELPYYLNSTRILIHVTAEQWGNGEQADFDALDPAVIQSSVDAAKDEEADVDKFDSKTKAIVIGMMKTVNLRLAEGEKMTKAEVVAAIRAEL